jgi:hypothetical protein
VRTTRSIALLFLAAACRHTPPDKEARAVAPPEQVPHTPTADELAGLWHSRALRGAFAELGTFAVYVFGPNGRYSGAIAGERESTPLEGTWSFAEGVLTIDDSIELRARVIGDRLQLSGEDAYLELVRPTRARRAQDEPVPR